MANISLNDNLFVSVSLLGRQFCSFMSCGIGSVEDIIEKVRSLPGAPRGLITLDVRNSSKGWSESRSFYLA